MIVDTQLLDRVGAGDFATGASWSVSSVTAQEALNMQVPTTEDRYRIALPLLRGMHLIERAPGRATFWLDHARSQPVSQRADRQILRLSPTAADRLEIGHASVAAAHRDGLDTLTSAYLSVLPEAPRKHAARRWRLLRDQATEVIALDADIATRGVELLRDFLAAGGQPKPVLRNTVNDMLILATALETGQPLATLDGALKDFYTHVGCIVELVGDVVIAAPVSTAGCRDAAPRDSKRYVNSLWRKRRPGDERLR